MRLQRHSLGWGVLCNGVMQPSRAEMNLQSDEKGMGFLIMSLFQILFFRHAREGGHPEQSLISYCHLDSRVRGNDDSEAET